MLCYVYDSKEYIRATGRMVIFKYQSATKGYRLQRDDVFSPVSRGIALITQLWRLSDQRVFE